MAQVIVTESSLQNIGTAIRSKLGTQDTYKPSEMAGAISLIHGDPVLETLTANANNTYTPSSGKDGFSQVVVNVPNSYTSGDEGKVVSNGALVGQSSQGINANGTYNTTLKNEVVVNVPNSYSASDEGKVVNNGALVAQSSRSITQNGTYDTTLKNQAIVNVPNSYSASDEGKVVSNGALVAQSSQSITQNGTYDTTLKNQVTVNVSGGGSVLVPKTITQNGTYNPASDNADGYSQVVVNVSGGGNVESLIPVYEGLSYGYISEGKFEGWTTKTNYLLLFECDANEPYLLIKTDTTGNRMRGGFFAGKSLSDFMNGINTPQSGTIYNGTQVVNINDSNTTARKFIPSQNGILVVMTSSESVAAKAYCIKGLY